MAFPEIEQHRVKKLFDKFCENRIPPDVRHQLKMTYKITGSKVILMESRPYYDDPTKWSELPIAQFEYSVATKGWSLYAYDRNNKRRLYSKVNLEKLIQEVDQDPTCIFWG